MKLVVGLGNPGKVYSSSRHNAGFMVVIALAEKHKVSLKRGFLSSSLTAKIKINGEQVVLAQPLSFMNLSGSVVKTLLKKYKISANDLLVICDDMDLEFGRLKLRPDGSSGGHKGLDSISKSLANNEYCRLRIGVGRPHERIDPADYVLAPFNKIELKEAEGVIDTAVSCVESWITQGLSETMNNYNKRSKSNE
ncbi:MAG: aminoacyl-tRNA hydrolase [Candidatus Omnitrophica bacterium]|nr:aminoacyl-tRNA hydrolase [Candidatus Omnitrophota bacterium]